MTKRQKYKIKNQEDAIGVSIDSWISFGNGNDLYLYNELKSRGGGTCTYNYDIPGNNPNDLNGGNNSFKLLNCEVYQIGF